MPGLSRADQFSGKPVVSTTRPLNLQHPENSAVLHIPVSKIHPPTRPSVELGLESRPPQGKRRLRGSNAPRPPAVLPRWIEDRGIEAGQCLHRPCADGVKIEAGRGATRQNMSKAGISFSPSLPSGRLAALFPSILFTAGSLLRAARSAEAGQPSGVVSPLLFPAA